MTIERDEFNRFADSTTAALTRIESAVNSMHQRVAEAHSTLALHSARLQKLENPEGENKPVTRVQLRIAMGTIIALIAVLKFIKFF